jgi:hypothetical protein
MAITIASVERALAEGRWKELEATLARDEQVGRWLARALGRDLSVVTAHPELIFPCAYRHLRRHGGDDGLPPIRALLDDWQRQQREGGGGRWLRALRPMAVPLDAPLIEEHRGAHPPGRPDWRPAAEPRFSLDWSKRRLGWAACRDRIDGQTHEVVVDDGDASFSEIADLPEGDALVAGWWDDYDGVVCRVTPTAGRVVWRTNLDHAIGGVALSPDARLALVHDGRRCFAIDVETGGAVRPIDLVPPAPCSFSPDGTLIAVEGDGSVQVWDLRRLLAERWPEATGRRGLVDAEFSPDGELLLTGARLSDGKTGRLIATLDVEDGGYLEGGPPARGRRMVRGGFVEATPHGMYRWDAAGRLVMRSKSWYSLADEVLFASNGETFALGPGHGQEKPIELRRVGDDRLLATIEARCTHVFEWSPDDGHLAFVTADDRLRLADLDGSCRELGQIHEARELRFSIDGALIRSTAEDGALQMWDARRGGIAEGAVFRDRAHPYVGRFEHGLFEIADERTNAVVARIPSDKALVSDATGTFWAGRRSHYELAAT